MIKNFPFRNSIEEPKISPQLKESPTNKTEFHKPDNKKLSELKVTALSNFNSDFDRHRTNDSYDYAINGYNSLEFSPKTLHNLNHSEETSNHISLNNPERIISQNIEMNGIKSNKDNESEFVSYINLAFEQEHQV